MKNILGKLEIFDLLCIVVFFILLYVSIYFFSISNMVLAILLTALSLWAILIPVGKIIFAPAYLEGHMVRLLIKNGGAMQMQDIQKYYEQYGTIDFAFEQLENRGVIDMKDTIIKLVDENINEGFKNKLMMLGTRRVKL